MEAFVGAWKLVSSENLDEYLNAVGYHPEAVQIWNIVTPVISISQDRNKVVMKTKTSITNREISFTLGEEFDEDTYNIQSKSVVYLEGDKLVHVKKWDDKVCTHTHEIKDGQMSVTATCGDAVAVRTFERIGEVA